VHSQVVLCPGWNDGAQLDRTLSELWELGSGVLSLSVVPVGLTRYNVGRDVRLLTRLEASAALDQVDAARERALTERGTGWAYAGDELYFIAGRPLPGASYYDDWPLTENGVGAVRALLDDFAAGAAALPLLAGRRIAIVTGTRMAPIMASLAPALAARTAAVVEVIPVRNRMFGDTVNTAGLLPGADVADAVAAAGAFDSVLLPAEALNDDELFIDSMPLSELARSVAPASVVPAHSLTSALAGL
jgi:NifB/MoaA-like Fe-S oxidoreductase